MPPAPRTLKVAPTAEDVVTLARTRIERVYKKFDHVAVAFSGGKDSTCCLQLTLDVARKLGRLPLDVVHWDEEANTPETVEYLKRVQANPDVALRWYCVPIKHRNACSTKQPYWYAWAPEEKHLWCWPLPDGAITEIPGMGRIPYSDANPYLFPPGKFGTVGWIVGIRADESLRRRRALTFRVHDNWISQDPLAPNVYQCKPIYDWKTADVWTAPQHFGWDYNRTYDLLDKLGITPHAQRVAPPFGQEPFQRLWQYAQLWPELWERMINRVDGAACAGRYSRSPLYSATAAPEKPADMSWHDAIEQALQKWELPTRDVVRERLRKEIRRHNKQTNNATIPDEAQVGLSWEFLYRIAVSGDLKSRKNVVLDVDAFNAGRWGVAGDKALRR